MADKVYKISGQFDASSIIKGFKEIRSEMSKVGVSPDMFKGLDKDLEKLTKLSETFKEMREKGFSNTREVEKYNQILSQMGDVINHTNKEFIKLNQSSNFKVNAKGIENLTKQMLQASDSVENMKDSIQNIVKKSSNFSLKKVRDELAEAVEEGRELSSIIEKAWSDQSTKGFKSVQKQLGAKNADGSVNKDLFDVITGSQIKLNTQLDSKHIDDYKTALAELMLTGKSVKQTFDDLGVELSEEEQKYASSAKFVEDYQKDLQALGKQVAQGRVKNIGSFVSQLNKATSIGGYDINGKFQLTGTDGNAIQNYDTAVVQLTTSTKQLNDAQEEATKQGIKLQNEWENSANKKIDTFNKQAAFEREEIQATYANIQAQDRLDDSFAALQNRLKQLLSLGSAYRMFRNVIQQTYNDVQDLDKAFGEIAMVTNYTVQDLWSQYDNYAAMANRLGQQTVSVIQASGLFYQQGLDTAEALALTEDTMKLATLAGLDFADATSQMTAAIRAFHMEMDEGSHVTDVYAELAAHAAADVKGIANAMSKTASIANSAGMSFENTATFLTTMIEATQEAPDNIGTALKTVIARFTELKENVAGTADSAFDDLDYNKVDKALKSVGISIKDVNGQFRNLDEVFLELGEKWSTLDRNTQRYIATIAAGSRQQSRFVALLDNYDRVKQLQEVAANSEGRADEQFAKFADTLEYKMNQLKNSWEQMRTSFLNSEFFKDIVDGITGVVNKLKEFDAKDFAEFALLFSTLGKSVVSNFIKGMHDSSSAISTAFNSVIKKVKASIDKKLSISPRLNVDLAEINRLEQRISSYKQIQIDILADIPDFEKVYNELMQLVEEKNLLTENGTIDISGLADAYENVHPGGWDTRYGAFFAAGNSQLLAEEAQKKLIQSTETTRKLADQRGQMIGQALMAGITTAIISLKDSDQSPSEALKTILGGIGTSIAPMILNIGITAGKAALTAGNTLGSAIGSGITAGLAATGIGLAIVAALGGAVALYKLSQEQTAKQIKKYENESEINKRINRINALSEAQEKLATETAEATEKAKEESEAYKQLTDAKDSLDEYTSKISLTNEQQEEFKNLQNEIAEQIPNMIDHYDAEGNAILKMGSAWDEVIEKQRIAAAEAEKAKAESEIKESVATYEKAVEENKRANEIIKILDNKSSAIGFLRSARTSADNFLNFDIYSSIRGETPWETLDENTNNLTDFFQGLKALYGGDTSGNLISGNEIKQANQYGISSKQDVDELIDFIRKAYEEAGNDTFKNKGTDEILNIILDYDDSELKSLQETLEKSYSTLSLLKENAGAKEIEEASTKLDQASKNLLESELRLDKDFTNYSKNVQELGIILAEGGSLEAYRNIWEKTHSIEDYGNDGTAYLNALLTDYNEDENFKDKAIEKAQDLIKKYANDIDDYFKTVDKNNLNIIERLAEISAIKNEEVRDGLEKLEKENIDAYNQDFQAIADALGATTTMGDNGLLTSTDEGLNKLANLSDVARTQLARMFADAKFGAGELAKEILNIQDKYKNLDLSTLLSIDWENMSIMDLKSTKKAIIETLSESMTSSEAEQAWEDFFNLAREFNLFDLITPDTNTDAIMEKATEDMAKRIEATNSVASAVKNQLTDGFISFTDSQTVEKACKELGLDAADYINYGLNGERLTLDTDKLKEDIQDQAVSAGDIVKQMQAEVDYNIELLNQQIGILKGEDERIEKIYEQNEQYAIQAKILQGLGLYEGPVPDSLLKEPERIGEGIDVLEGKIQEWKDWATENLDPDSPFIQQLIGKYNAGELEILDIFDNIETEVAKTVEDNSEKMTAAKDKVTEANKKLAESERELQKAIQGDSTRQSKLDGLYNYQTRLEQLNKQIGRSKNDLEDIQSDTDVRSTLQNLKSDVHAETVTKQAENEVYKQAIAKQNDILSKQLAERIKQINAERGVNMSTNIADYFTDTNGRFSANFAAINAAGLNDEFKDYVEESIDNMNKYRIAIEDNTDAIKDRAKELRDFEKKAIDARVALEDKVVEVLRDKYEQEIDNIKDRNDAIEDANNDYLDALEKAINKERSLRDRQREWDDLAKQEKKLSLMQRDTSGANRVETANLEEDINKQREDLLDKSVDSIIEQLKEMYEEQQESREIEIEYMEAMLDNAALVKEANEIIKNWNGAEDAKQWFRDNIKEYSEWSQAKIQQEELGWEELFNNQTLYTETMTAKLGESIETTHDEIKKAVDSTSQNLIENTNRAFTAIGNKVDEIIGKAQDAVEDAKKAVAEAEKARDKLANTGSGSKKNNKGDIILDKDATKKSAENAATATLGHILASTPNINSTPMSAAQSAIDKMKNGSNMSYGEQNARAADNRAKKEGNEARGAERNKILQLLGGTTNVKTAAENLYQNIAWEAKGFWIGDYSLNTIKEVIKELKEQESLYFGSVNDKILYVARTQSLLDQKFPGVNYKKYAKGGLVPYTGPAWVDGTPSRPEAFLSADDTERIGQLTQLLENIPFFNSTIPSDNISTTNIGDTTIEVNITIENVSSDYDVDQAVERVKQDIVSAARYTGSNVILKQ